MQGEVFFFLTSPYHGGQFVVLPKPRDARRPSLIEDVRQLGAFGLVPKDTDLVALSYALAIVLAPLPVVRFGEYITRTARFVG